MPNGVGKRKNFPGNCRKYSNNKRASVKTQSNKRDIDEKYCQRDPCESGAVCIDTDSVSSAVWIQLAFCMEFDRSSSKRIKLPIHTFSPNKLDELLYMGHFPLGVLVS